jgi:hypothetical protein
MAYPIKGKVSRIYQMPKSSTGCAGHQNQLPQKKGKGEKRLTNPFPVIVRSNYDRVYNIRKVQIVKHF